jgi:hypothetical protein
MAITEDTVLLLSREPASTVLLLFVVNHMLVCADRLYLTILRVGTDCKRDGNRDTTIQISF